MQIKLFAIPVTDDGTILAEMNRFLRSNRILEVRENFYSNENGAEWCFSIRYMEPKFGRQGEQSKRIDYKDVLDEQTFEKFCRLREIRKKAATEEAVPAFAIFTDEELAVLAALNAITRNDLLSIKGIGEKKVERYGHYFITKEPEP